MAEYEFIDLSQPLDDTALNVPTVSEVTMEVPTDHMHRGLVLAMQEGLEELIEGGSDEVDASVHELAEQTATSIRTIKPLTIPSTLAEAAIKGLEASGVIESETPSNGPESSVVSLADHFDRNIERLAKIAARQRIIRRAA